MEMKVLAFEDSVDIEALLLSSGVSRDNFLIKQYWDSHDYLNRIENYDPDVLLLDHYMPPTKGLTLLQNLLKSDIKRPSIIVAMSSANMANQAMKKSGADFAIEKFRLSELIIWNQS